MTPILAASLTLIAFFTLDFLARSIRFMIIRPLPYFRARTLSAQAAFWESLFVFVRGNPSWVKSRIWTVEMALVLTAAAVQTPFLSPSTLERPDLHFVLLMLFAIMVRSLGVWTCGPEALWGRTLREVLVSTILGVVVLATIEASMVAYQVRSFFDLVNMGPLLSVNPAHAVFFAVCLGLVFLLFSGDESELAAGTTDQVVRQFSEVAWIFFVVTVFLYTDFNSGLINAAYVLVWTLVFLALSRTIREFAPRLPWKQVVRPLFRVALPIWAVGIGYILLEYFL